MLTIKSFGEFVGQLFDFGTKERERELEAIKQHLLEEKKYLEKLINSGQSYQQAQRQVYTVYGAGGGGGSGAAGSVTWSSTSQSTVTATTSSALPVLSACRMTAHRQTLYGHDGIGTSRLFLLAYDGSKEFFYEVVYPEVVDQIAAWVNDKELMKYSRQRLSTHSRKTQMEYMLSNFGRENLMTLNPAKYWLIFRMDGEVSNTATLIGTISTHPLAGRDGVDIGIMIGNPEGQGKGYAAEAMSGVINWHHARGATLFHIGTDEKNQKMIRLAETCGLKEYDRDEGFVYMEMKVPPASTLVTAEKREAGHESGDIFRRNDYTIIPLTKSLP